MIKISGVKIQADGIVCLNWSELLGLRVITNQIWIRRRAHRQTRCAISGALIRPGDNAYTPIGEPPNRDRHIAPTLLEQTRAYA